MRVFLDTNVLVAAFATRGLCADVLRVVLAEHELLLSPTLIEELTWALTKKIRVPEETVRTICAFLRASALFVDAPPKAPPLAVRDPDDAVILGEALASEADVLVTGDKDLLDLREIPGLRVLDPRGFWRLVCRPGPSGSRLAEATAPYDREMVVDEFAPPSGAARARWRRARRKPSRPRRGKGTRSSQ